MGIVPPAPGFNAAIRRVTAEHGALMILDEVLTGFRVGPAGWWGLEAVDGWVSNLPVFTAGPSTAGATSSEPADVAAPSWPGANWRERAAWVPDLVTFGKVVGGGMPLAAIGGRAEVMDLLAPDGPVYQAGTLSGNPLATAAGLATLRLPTTPSTPRWPPAPWPSARWSRRPDRAGRAPPRAAGCSLFSFMFGQRAGRAGR